jgi:peptide-methionine (R)-S-oxide reductase
MFHGYPLYTPENIPDFPLVFTEQQWRKILDPRQYGVLRGKATERPFSGEYYRAC